MDGTMDARVCEDCGGTGTMACRHCGGTGRNPENGKAKCPGCNGSGEQECRTHRPVG